MITLVMFFVLVFVATCVAQWVWKKSNEYDDSLPGIKDLHSDDEREIDDFYGGGV